MARPLVFFVIIAGALHTLAQLQTQTTILQYSTLTLSRNSCSTSYRARKPSRVARTTKISRTRVTWSSRTTTTVRATARTSTPSVSSLPNTIPLSSPPPNTVTSLPNTILLSAPPGNSQAFTSIVQVNVTSTIDIAGIVTVTNTRTVNGTSTSTVPVTAALTPFADSFVREMQSGTGGPAGRNVVPEKRQEQETDIILSGDEKVEHESDDVSEAVTMHQPHLLSRQSRRFPGKITCTRMIYTIILAELKIFQIVTSGQSSVSSNGPVSGSATGPASARTVTITFTNTALVTRTVGSPSTTTVFVETTSTPLYYAACAANNVFGPQDSSGRWLEGVQNRGNTRQLLLGNSASPYDCCASCFSTPNCVYSQYVDSPRSCGITVDNIRTCDASYREGAVYVTTQQDPTYKGFYYSNGYCGALGFNGVDS